MEPNTMIEDFQIIPARPDPLYRVLGRSLWRDTRGVPDGRRTEWLWYPSARELVRYCLREHARDCAGLSEVRPPHWSYDCIRRIGEPAAKPLYLSLLDPDSANFIFMFDIEQARAVDNADRGWITAINLCYIMQGLNRDQYEKKDLDQVDAAFRRFESAIPGLTGAQAIRSDHHLAQIAQYRAKYIPERPKTKSGKKSKTS